MVLAQKWNFSLQHFDISTGLPSNKVYFLAKDSLGFLWVGTDAGVARYNGNEFLNYNSDHGLPSNDVYEVFCDSKNRIWLTTMGNQVSYIHNGKVHNSLNDSVLSKIKIPNRISRIIEEKNGDIWVIAFPFVINVIKSNKLVVIDSMNKLGNCYKTIKINNGILFVLDKMSVFYDDSLKMFKVNNSNTFKINDLINCGNNEIIYSDLNNDIQKLNTNPQNVGFSSFVNVLSLFEAHGKIWQLRHDGLKRWDINNNLKSDQSYLDDYSVSNFVNIDQKNNWISTLNSGIFNVCSPQLLNFKPSLTEASNSISAVFKEKNVIAIGRNNGTVTIISNRQKIKNIKLSDKSILSFRVLKIIQHNNCLIICTDIGLFSISLLNYCVKNLCERSAYKNIFYSNDTLLTLDHISISYYDKKFNKVKNHFKGRRFYSHTIYQNKKLFGSENALYYEDDSLKIYKLDQPFHYRLMDMKTKDSLLVIATAEKGVFFIHDHQIIRNLNLQGGLNSNSATKILEYKNQWVIATNNGIAMYDFKTKNLDKIMESDGLASNNVLDIAIDNDTLYAGTDNGLSVIPINSLKPRKSFKFFVNPISVNKDTIWNITDTIKSHTGYRIYAALNAISLGVKGGVTFYYRVNERDSNFYATNDPNVNLTFSKVGTYTFEAYGIDINNIKSVRSILTIVVVPFWYQTQVFKWSCIIAALLFIYLFIRVLSYYVRKREQEKIAVQNRITKLELDVWKSNINPHFLYNSLNIIQSLFLNNKFEDANRYVGTFTSVLRNTIDNSEHLMNKIDEEIQYLHDYLELECMKRSGRLSFEIQADETSSVTSFYMPSLLLQPIVENSIKHGLKQGANCHILIQFELKGELIVATVQDNGPGLPEENKNYTNSKGLSLVQDKIRLVENITNQKIVFVMGNLYNVSNKPCGVISKFTLPLFSKQDFELG